MSLAFARAYLQDGCTFWDQVTIKELGSSMMRKLEIGVSRNMNLSGIVTMILGAMYVGAMAMVVFLILVQLVEFALLQVEVQKLTSPKNPRITLRPQARLEAKAGMCMAFPGGVEIEPK